MDIQNIGECALVRPGRKVSLRKDFDPDYKDNGLNKKQSEALLRLSVQELARCQDRLYAQNTHAVLVIFQAMDAAGKDGAIKHVMSGLNPQGCQVFSFKAPSSEELDHGYLWRCFKALPERGRIGIFNRSYYEEVLTVRVHPELLERQQIPRELKDKNLWDRRYAEINGFEQYLTNNGTSVVKIFLNVSKEEQRQRFLERLDRPEKNWKFSLSDVREREFWDDYMSAYQDMLNHTSTKWAPWHVVPANHKWFARLCVASIICDKLKSLNCQYPEVDSQQLSKLKDARELLGKGDSVAAAAGAHGRSPKKGRG